MLYKIYHVDLPYVDGLSFMVVAVFKDGGRLTAEWFLAIPDDACTFVADRVVPVEVGGPVEHELFTEDGLLRFAFLDARCRLWAYERDAAQRDGRPFKAPAMIEDNKHFFVSYWLRGKCRDNIERIIGGTLMKTLREDLQRVATLPDLKRQRI